MKILMNMVNFSVGGTERSFLNFCNFIGVENELDIQLFSYSGGMLNQLKATGLRQLKTTDFLQKYYAASRHYGKLQNLFHKFTVVIGLNHVFWKKQLSRIAPVDQYDVAICYSAHNFDSCNYILNHVKAAQKWVFVHHDITITPISARTMSCINKFDKIICVSNSIADAFKIKYPKLANKIDYLYNFFNTEEVVAKSREKIAPFLESSTLNMITIARVSPIKGHLRFAQVINRIVHENPALEFKWYVVGVGQDLKKLEKFIETNNLQNYIRCLGLKENPYPYLLQSDLFVLPSYAEAWGLVLIESMSLGVPVLTTNLISATESVGENGIVCDNSEEGLYNALKQVLQNPEILNAYRKKLNSYKFDNNIIKEKFYYMVKNENINSAL